MHAHEGHAFGSSSGVIPADAHSGDRNVVVAVRRVHRRGRGDADRERCRLLNRGRRERADTDDVRLAAGHRHGVDSRFEADVVVVASDHVRRVVRAGGLVVDSDAAVEGHVSVVDRRELVELGDGGSEQEPDVLIDLIVTESSRVANERVERKPSAVRCTRRVERRQAEHCDGCVRAIIVRRSRRRRRRDEDVERGRLLERRSAVGAGADRVGRTHREVDTEHCGFDARTAVVITTDDVRRNIRAARGAVDCESTVEGRVACVDDGDVMCTRHRRCEGEPHVGVDLLVAEAAHVANEHVEREARSVGCQGRIKVGHAERGRDRADAVIVRGRLRGCTRCADEAGQGE